MRDRQQSLAVPAYAWHVELTHPFSVFTPTADGDALMVLAGADKAFTASEVRTVAGRRSIEGMRQALKRLAAQGIATAQRAGNTTVYRLNREHLGAQPAIAIANIRFELMDRIRSRLAEWNPQPAYAAMFGSAARGDMHTDSDIDVLIVRPNDIEPDHNSWFNQQQALAQSISTWTGNDARVLELSEHEVLIEATKGRSVLQDIRSDAVWLAGPQTYLHERLLARGA